MSASRPRPMPMLSRHVSAQCDTRLLHVSVIIATILSLGTLVSGDGLIVVPATVTNELGAYYLTKLATDNKGLVYYSTLIARNVEGTNAYARVNGITPSESPQVAARRTSLVRGRYVENTWGGKTTVEIFYKVIRCEEDSCYKLSRVIALNPPRRTADPQNAVLGYLRIGIGGSPWLVNAGQPAVNDFLARAGVEYRFEDSLSRSQLFFKVSAPGSPCSSASPRTAVGSIAEFENLPQFACLSYRGVKFMAGVDDRANYNSLLQPFAIPAAECNGSVTLFYTLHTQAYGPWIIVRRYNPESVPLYIVMKLPSNNLLECFHLFDTPTNTLQAVAILASMDFESITLPSVNLKSEIGIPASIEALGFNGTCSPTYFGSTYIVSNADETEGIKSELSADPNFIGKLIPYNGTEDCSCVIGREQAGATLTTAFDATCAQLYYGNPFEQVEAIVTYANLDAVSPTRENVSRGGGILSASCDAGNHVTIRSILPQIAIDFETDKSALLSSTEVKLHLDSVIANAAATLAIEIALCASGVGSLVAQFLARFGCYRRGHLPQAAAAVLAAATTALLITLFNAPNLALIGRSLRNNDDVRAYTQTSVRQYKPSNYSAVLFAETHAFVTVRGAAATAFVGLGLYALTLIFCVATAVLEFAAIGQRRSEATSRLGRKALTADRHVLVEWRGTDALIFDTLQLQIDRATPSPLTGVKSQASLPDSDVELGSATLWRASDREIEVEKQSEGSPGTGDYEPAPRRIPPRYTRFARVNEPAQ